MFVECKVRDQQMLIPDTSIQAVVWESNSLTIYTTDGHSITLWGRRSDIWEAYSQIRNGLQRPAYYVDLTWLNEEESPAPEAVATGD